MEVQSVQAHKGKAVVLKARRRKTQDRKPARGDLVGAKPRGRQSQETKT
jgi:hypothetical protein